MIKDDLFREMKVFDSFVGLYTPYLDGHFSLKVTFKRNKKDTERLLFWGDSSEVRNQVYKHFKKLLREDMMQNNLDEILLRNMEFLKAN